MSRTSRTAVTFVFAIALTTGASNASGQDTPPTAEETDSATGYDFTNPYDMASMVVQALKDRDWQTMATHHDNPDDILLLQEDPALFEERVAGWRLEAIEAAPVPITELRWVRNSDNRVWAFMDDINAEEVAVLRLERTETGWAWEDVNSLSREVWESALHVEGF